MTYDPKTTTPIPIPLGGGLNTKPGVMHIEQNQSPNCKNVYGGLSTILQRRNDYDTIATASDGYDGNGMMMFNVTDTEQMMLCYIDTYLYKMDSVDTLYDGVLDPIAFATPMSDDIMEIEQIEEGGVRYAALATHSRDVLQKYDGTSSSTTDLSADPDCPRPKFIKFWRGFLFCANLEGNENRVAYQETAYDITASDSWTALDYQTVATNDGDVITGLAILEGRLYTFKNNSIHMWTYLGGTPLFSVKEIVSGVGTASSKSIVNINHPKLGNVLMFVSSEGKIYAFDGSQVHLLSDNIENDNEVSEFSISKINTAYLSKACSLDYKKRHWYMTWLPTASANNWCLVYNYYTGAFWPFDAMDASACCIGRDNGKYKPYFINDDGVVKQADYSGSTTRTISAYYDTAKFDAGIMPLLKKQQYMDLHCKNTPQGVVTVSHKSDWSETWSDLEDVDFDAGGFVLGESMLGVDTLGGPRAKIKTVDLPFVSHSEEFRFSSNDNEAPWAIYAAYILVSGVGYGKGTD